MESSKRIVFLIGCLLLAFICYGIGMHSEALLLIVLGGLFECLFWLRLFKPNTRK
ncbi:hypothetical protein [Shewanella sp. Isolate11]|uniref:hypothetical protein n=1 Tax=Shewanella sp. Isolate11 TaxID=2908530 RepID=UPI001EFDF50A|nr:hypothetical protein [Shewanella sp. Isolate11]MCG9698176.1 hypothetical protein [Shewanella sp. Isolate11]